MIQIRASVASNQSAMIEKQVKEGNSWQCYMKYHMQDPAYGNEGSKTRKFIIWFTWDKHPGYWITSSRSECEKWGCPYIDDSCEYPKAKPWQTADGNLKEYGLREYFVGFVLPWDR